MHPTVQRPKVIVRHCDAYDAEQIRTIIREGLEELDLRPEGRTLVKPNLVCAGPMFEHAHTRPEFTEGVLLGLQDRDEGGMTELAVGERCGITIPTRLTFERSGHNAMLKRHRDVKKYYFEEEQQVEIPLSHEGRLRDYLFTPEPVARADFFVNCPKYKAHPWTTVTFGNKAYIGIQDDRHRLIDHDAKLNEKIADLQYILQPKFLAIDAITAGEGRMLTPIPKDLNLVIMGNNQCAFDAVCCAIIGVDPFSVDHIRMPHERGFGPLSLDEIEITGDVSLADAQARAAGFKVGLVRVEKYFEGTHISAYAGPPPASEGHEYCWGGCPGALEEAIEILRKVDETCDETLPRLHIVFGNYQGPIDYRGEPDERVIFIGDCAEWQGTLADQPIAIENLYKDRSTLDPYTAGSKDIVHKLMKVQREIKEHKDLPYLRMTGCPVSVAEQVNVLVHLGGLKDPVRDWPGIKAYLAWKSSVAMKRMVGKRYQVKGEAERGDAKPEGMNPAAAE